MYIIKDKNAAGLIWTGTKFAFKGYTAPKIWGDVVAAMACAYGGTAKGPGKAKAYAEHPGNAGMNHAPVVVRIDLIEHSEVPPASECQAACESVGLNQFTETKGDYG